MRRNPYDALGHFAKVVSDADKSITDPDKRNVAFLDLATTALCIANRKLQDILKRNEDL